MSWLRNPSANFRLVVISVALILAAQAIAQVIGEPPTRLNPAGKAPGQTVPSLRNNTGGTPPLPPAP